MIINLAAGGYNDLHQVKNLLDKIWGEGRKKKLYYQEMNSSILLQFKKYFKN